MTILRAGWLIVPLAAVLGCGAEPGKPAAGSVAPIAVTKVNYEQFDQAVKSHKGQVVLIDVWFRGCPPCVKKFPHLVELHNKYGSKGLVCVSLNPVDIEAADLPKVEKFLTEKGAAFPNYLLDDTVEHRTKWNEKYPTDVTPTVILFRRDGTRYKATDDATAEEIEADVEKLLAEK